MHLVFLLLLTLPTEALPNATVGRVVAVADGDTLTLLSKERQIKIRLDRDIPRNGVSMAFRIGQIENRESISPPSPREGLI